MKSAHYFQIDGLSLVINSLPQPSFTHFHQTYNNDGLWDTDECVIFWGQKVKGQGPRIQYAGNSTFSFLIPLVGGIPYSTTWCRVIFI